MHREVQCPTLAGPSTYTLHFHPSLGLGKTLLEVAQAMCVHAASQDICVPTVLAQNIHFCWLCSHPYRKQLSEAHPDTATILSWSGDTPILEWGHPRAHSSPEETLQVKQQQSHHCPPSEQLHVTADT